MKICFKKSFTKIIALLFFVIVVVIATVSCTEGSLTKLPDQSGVEHEPPRFDEDMHSPNTLFVILNHKTVGGMELGVVFEKNENGQVQIGYDSFDQIAVKYDFVEMFQSRLFFDTVHFFEDAEWLGFFRENVFLITLRDGNVIQDAAKALLNDDSVLPQLDCGAIGVGYTLQGGPIFNEDLHCPESLLVCFDDQIYGFFEWSFEVAKDDNGNIRIGNESFDSIAATYGFTGMSQLFLGLDFYETQINYTNNVFRIKLDAPELIHNALSDLLSDNGIVNASYDYCVCAYQWRKK